MGLRKISEKTGFTLLEIKVLLFLLIIFIAGLGIKSLIINTNSARNKIVYDYSEQDSLFLNLKAQNEPVKNGVKASDKNVDYKQEVLDFREPEFNRDDSEKELSEKSININTAGKESLMLLPGIGPKTADKIIEYRQRTGKFKELIELLDVYGIGNSKFSKIKKYLYIEK